MQGSTVADLPNDTKAVVAAFAPDAIPLETRVFFPSDPEEFEQAVQNALHTEHFTRLGGIIFAVREGTVHTPALIPPSSVSSFRNLMSGLHWVKSVAVHGYDGGDDSVFWEAVLDLLPNLESLSVPRSEFRGCDMVLRNDIGQALRNAKHLRRLRLGLITPESSPVADYVCSIRSLDRLFLSVRGDIMWMIRTPFARVLSVSFDEPPRTKALNHFNWFGILTQQGGIERVSIGGRYLVDTLPANAPINHDRRQIRPLLEVRASDSENINPADWSKLHPLSTALVIERMTVRIDVSRHRPKWSTHPGETAAAVLGCVGSIAKAVNGPCTYDFRMLDYKDGTAHADAFRIIHGCFPPSLGRRLIDQRSVLRFKVPSTDADTLTAWLGKLSQMDLSDIYISDAFKRKRLLVSS